jgi:hypothetical protein|tara:strand:+ start:821 stop:1450 length:630 start_codon:yes stop_codon:yes gene_type:complete
MAITTFAELKTAVANFLARSDLTDRIPEFISMAEARMGRELETRSQEKRATATLTGGDAFVSLPTDLRSIRMVKLNTTPTEVLEYYTPQKINELYSSGGSGKPRAYTIIGGEIKFAPTPDSGYTAEIVYMEGVPDLSDSNTTNTILTRHPDLYLYGALSAASVYLMDDQKTQMYDSLFTRSMEELKREEEKGQHAGSGLFMKSDYGELT